MERVLKPEEIKGTCVELFKLNLARLITDADNKLTKKRYQNLVWNGEAYLSDKECVIPPRKVFDYQVIIRVKEIYPSNLMGKIDIRCTLIWISRICAMIAKNGDILGHKVKRTDVQAIDGNNERIYEVRYLLCA